MKCQNLFSGKNKINRSICRLLKILVNVLSAKSVLYRDLASKQGGSVAQLDAGGRGFSPRRGRQHSFVEIDHEIYFDTKYFRKKNNRS